MSDVAIRVQEISKRYQIGRAPRQQSLREAVTGVARATVGRLHGRAAHSARDTVWALDGVSFEIERGEVIGIIG
ncbi:MAG TPA: ABC transporter ATP-binding protein, partial [Chloroflexi bacterium]|nr:ABC transporter ATP-binding protein [Chloroflexota bacterium]